MAKRKQQVDVIEVLKGKLEKYEGEASKRVPQNAIERLENLHRRKSLQMHLKDFVPKTLRKIHLHHQ